MVRDHGCVVRSLSFLDLIPGPGGLGLSAQDMEFFHSSAQIQLLYAHLFHHCIALRNLHTVADARALKPEVGVSSDSTSNRTNVCVDESCRIEGY